jgi:type IV pilus assembly protein PilW
MKRFQRYNQSGFTVVELMVAATISLILLAGLLQVFLGNKESYKLQEASSNVQENGRFGMQFLVKDIRMVGFMGCTNTNTVNLVNNVDLTKATTDVNNTVGQFDGTNAIIGYNYDGTFPADVTALGLTSADVVQGTDILYLQRAEGCPGGDVVCHNNTTTGSSKVCPTGTVSSAQYKIADNTACNIQQNDIILISDCVNADIHGVTNTPSGSIHVTIAHGANLNKSPKLANSYGDGSAIYKMIAELYYIGFGASGEPALYRRRLVGSNFVNEELVEGVYDMVLRYGEDTNSDGVANRYVTDTNVTDWENVVSVQATVYTRSVQDNVTEFPTTYTYNGASVTDNRLQRQFTFTTTIRNRVQ